MSPTSRRALLAGGTAGVGIAVAGSVPSLGNATPTAKPPRLARGRPSRRSWTIRTASSPCPRASPTPS